MDAVFRILLIANFVVLCNIWIATIFLSGMKNYKEILVLFALGYSIAVFSAVVLHESELNACYSVFYWATSPCWSA